MGQIFEKIQIFKLLPLKWLCNNISLFSVEFVHTPQDTEVDAGSTFVWDCTATGTPTPVLSWAKDGTKFQPGYPEHIRILSNNSLVIRGVKPGDAGQYQCHARNGVGAHVVQATLSVRGECFPVPLHSSSGFRCFAAAILNLNTRSADARSGTKTRGIWEGREILGRSDRARNII